MKALHIQGRSIAAEQLDWIRQLIREHPEWGRFHLSRFIAEQWNWRNGAGQLKDMAARTLLLKLERRALLQLPKRQRGGGSRPAQAPERTQRSLFTEALIQAKLDDLLPLHVELVVGGRERHVLSSLLSQYHYLGYRRPVGENLPYLTRDRSGRLLACLVFGAAAWKCAPRDQYIGWDSSSQERHLQLLANNMRFLVLPWVEVPQLAAHLLALVAERVSADWNNKYGHGIYLLESFVEQGRFSGVCYQAANWIRVGQTQSRSRNDQDRALHVPRKEVYLFPLTRSFRNRLQTPSPEQTSGPPRDSTNPPVPMTHSECHL